LRFGIIYDLLRLYMAVWCMCVVCVPLVYFTRFGMFEQRKIWRPCFTDVVTSKMSEEMSDRNVYIYTLGEPQRG
jgi:hypothetical protein